MSTEEKPDHSIQNILEKILKRLEEMRTMPTTTKPDSLVGYVFARAEEMLTELELRFDQSKAAEDLPTAMAYLKYQGCETVGAVVSTYTPSKLLTDLTQSNAALLKRKEEKEDRKARAGAVVAALKLAGLWEP